MHLPQELYKRILEKMGAQAGKISQKSSKKTESQQDVEYDLPKKMGM